MTNIEKKIDELRNEFLSRLKELVAELNQLKPELRTPDNIEFYDGSAGMGIIFNDQKQQLFYEYEVYKVASALCKPNIRKNLLLTPISREDLKPGDTAYRTDSGVTDFADIKGYCKILDGEKHAYVEYETDVIVGNVDFKFWYKVSL